MPKGFKSRSLPHEAVNRRIFHAAFADWTCHASDQEFLKLERLRENFAPAEVCSALQLVQHHMQRRDLMAKLPDGLLRRLQKQHWPRACVAVQSPASAA